MQGMGCRAAPVLLVAPGQGEGLWVLGVTSDSTDPAHSRLPKWHQQPKNIPIWGCGWERSAPDGTGKGVGVGEQWFRLL